MMDTTRTTYLDNAAQSWPHQAAIITANERLTFAELCTQAHAVRSALLAAGIRPGLGVGLVAHDGPAFMVGLFAALGCGAVVMPISPHLKRQELTRIFELVPLAGVLHDGSWGHESGATTVRVLHGLTLQLHPKEPHQPYQRIAHGVADAAVVRFTSGTTGASKGVVLSQHSLDERTRAAIEGLALKAGDRVAWVLPMVYHFIVSILTYVRYGVTTVIPDSLAPADICAAARHHNTTLLYAAPPIIAALTAAPDALKLPAQLRVTSTSAPLHADQARAFQLRFGIPVHQLYGLIEVGLPLGQRPSDPHGVGHPLPGYEATILSPELTPLPPGCIGRLAVRGPGMFDGYLAPFQPRAGVLAAGWFLTGDSAVRAADGSITVCGRESSVIHVNGTPVFPEEVEGVLCSFPGVQNARVFRVARPDRHEVIVAEVVPSPPPAVGARTLDLAALRSYLSARLSAHKIPAELRVVAALALTDSGKIIR